MTDSNFKDSLKLFQYVYNGLVNYLFFWFVTFLPFLASSNISVSKTNTQVKPGFLKVTICHKTENTPISGKHLDHLDSSDIFSERGTSLHLEKRVIV